MVAPVRFVPVDAIPAFVARLADAPAPPHAHALSAARNPYAGDGPAAIRRDNLARYLTRMAARRPRALLVGEAPGYRGCGATGVPFASAAILLAEPCPFGLFGAAAGFRLAEAGGPTGEATATILWDTLRALDSLPLLWNVCPFHPHRPGQPLSNRAPTAAEIAAGEWAVRELLALFGVERVIAVGRVAGAALGRWGIAATTVRHPSHGGRAAFGRQLAAVRL